MTRVCLILLALVLTTGAGPRRSLPVPPIPPAHPPADQTAPMPDRDAQAPTVAAAQSLTVDVRNYRAPNPDAGLGYAPGSRYRSEEDRKPLQTPGLMVRVPIP